MKKILIFDPDHRGHHLQFVTLIANAFCQSEMETTISIGANALETAEGQSHLATIHDKVKICPSLEFNPGQRSREIAFLKRRQLIQALGDHQPDHCVLPYGDGLVQVLGMMPWPKEFRSVTIDALVLRNRTATTLKGRLLSQLNNYLITRSPVRQVRFLNPESFYSIRSSSANPDRFSIMPEPVEQFSLQGRERAREIVGLKHEGKIVGCLGGINAEKNVTGLIDAFLETPQSLDARLLLVGKQDDCVREKLKSLDADALKRIIQIDRYVENEFFLNCFNASDVMVIPYKNRNSSSGIFVRAAYARKPVITDNEGWLARLNTSFGFGLTCDTMSTTSFSNAISTSLARQPVVALEEAQRRFRAFHTEQNFCQTWTHGFAGPENPLSEDPLTWDWVEAALPAGSPSHD